MLGPTKIIPGPIRINANSNDLGNQATDTVLLIGHADAPQNDPQRPLSLRDGVDYLNADDSSPLLRAMLECYSAGSRDIILCAAAPMSEYVAPEDRTESFYTTYFNRLTTTYNALRDYDYPDVVVPIEAVFADYDHTTPDFLGQLGNFLNHHFSNGHLMIGLLGVRGHGAITILSEDDRLSSMGDVGKLLAVVTGEGVFDYPEFNRTYTAPLAASVAGTMARLPLNIGIQGRILNSVSGFSHPQPKDADVKTAAEAKLIPAIGTLRGRRGVNFQVSVGTDNTLAPNGSDFESLSTLRMVQQVSDQIRRSCAPYIGESRDLHQLTEEVREVIDELHTANAFKDADYQVYYDKQFKDGLEIDDPSKVIIDVTISPWFTMRQVSFTITVGDKL